jgi:hypothetical protein
MYSDDNTTTLSRKALEPRDRRLVRSFRNFFDAGGTEADAYALLIYARNDNRAGGRPLSEAQLEARVKGKKKKSPELSAAARLMAAASQRVHQAVSATIMDTYRVRDGRVIGDVRFSEVPHLRAQGGYEVALLDAILAYGIPPDPSSRIRDYMPAKDLEALGAKLAHA